MSWAISSADVWASLMMRARVTNMRPHDATPTVTATLTAMSQIFVRMVTIGANPTPEPPGRTEARSGGGASRAAVLGQAEARSGRQGRPQRRVTTRSLADERQRRGRND